MPDLDSLRSKAYQLLMSPSGNRLAPVRWSRNALRYANDLAGRPLASQDEIDERRQYELAEELRDQEQNAPAEGEAAPVFLYHLDKHVSRLRKITDVLDATGVPYQVLNIEGDLAAREALDRESRFPLPVVVVAGNAVGGAAQVEKLHISGSFRELVYSV